jgi:hypothetical protein
MRVLQINLHHSRAASAALCVAMRNCNVALIPEPWTYKGEIKGLEEIGGELIYSRSNQNPRTCILVKKKLSDTAIGAILLQRPYGS